ncbi:MAG: hypothetical protein JRI68_18375 [Deltaproteobacteria bacterium]|nr:hypothetical protein [Deltaproteobacteria bacterium]
MFGLSSPQSRLALGCASLVACHAVIGADDFSVGAPQEGGAAGTTHTGGLGGGGSNGGGGSSSSSSGAAGSGGNGGGGGAGGQEPCHLDGLQDHFNDTQIGSYLTGQCVSTGNYGMDGAVAFAEPADGLAGAQRCGFHTNLLYDLLDCAVWIEVQSVLTQGTAAYTTFRFSAGTGDTIGVTHQAAPNVLSFEVVENQATTTSASVSYNGVTHRWWRIREAAGTVYVETSPDTVHWTIELTAPSPGFVDEGRVLFMAGTTSYALDPGRAEFDNLNELP